MNKILKKIINIGLIDGVKTECLVSKKDAFIIGDPYISGNRIHAKTNDLNSGFIVLYDEGVFAKKIK